MLFLYLASLEPVEEKTILEEIYKENIDYFISYAMTFLKDLSKAQEAVHEAFLYVLEKRPDYLKLEKEDLKRLMLSIIRGKSIDQIRKEKKYMNKSLEDLEIYLEPKNSIDEKIEKEEEVQGLKRQLEKLDQISYQILLFRYRDKMSYKEIGQILNMEIKTVEVRLYRAKEKIRANMKKEGLLDG
ncbi:MAG: sigma-70 family RNA polymerase sigma factor [Bacillota bacterium]|nr:sigma-70 family RNA polymerase sigma factor [Bacillota bacterium]